MLTITKELSFHVFKKRVVSKSNAGGVVRLILYAPFLMLLKI
jgi:hypothetical protein